MKSRKETEGRSRGRTKSPDKPRKRRRRHHHRQHDQHHVHDWFSWADWTRWLPDDGEPVERSLDEAERLEQIDSSLLSEKGRALLEARRTADRKVGIYRELTRAGLITLPLLLFLFPVGVVALVYFAAKLGRRTYRVLIEPEMRERLVRAEVEKQLRQNVHDQRRSLEDEHARSLEQLSARVAHEIRNPITAAKSLVQQMGEEPDSSDNVEYAQVALAELERVERSVSHLLRFARDEDLQLVDLKLVEVVESAVETFRDRSLRSGITVDRRFDSDAPVRGDADKLRRVVINLVGNAIEALEDGHVDEPRIEVSLGENLAGTEVWLRVRDNGVGIEPGARESLFDPFVTSKSSGTGLGLPITRKLVEGHGGTIEVESQPGMGAVFVVTFPKNAPSAARADGPGVTGLGGVKQ